MNLLETVVDAIWGGFAAEDNACVDREMDLIDTGGSWEVFSMQRVAQHVIDKLGLTEEFKHLEDGWGGQMVAPDGTITAIGEPATRVTRLVGKWIPDSVTPPT